MLEGNKLMHDYESSFTEMQQKNRKTPNTLILKKTDFKKLAA
jgi:hypothetical protein